MIVYNLIGQRFGRLVVQSMLPSRRGKRMWTCTCDCGKTVSVVTQSLRNGHTRSCGCLREDAARTTATKHGCFGTPTYVTWASMVQRCNNPSQSAFARYGARGVTVCERWLSFENFLEDMGERPTGRTIDRIDPGGNYEPGNCRWATSAEQTRNRRVTKLSPDLAHSIRERARSGEDRKSIARSLNLSKSTVGGVIRRETWREETP